MEFLTELENKVEALIATLERAREENAQLKNELEKAGSKFSEVESENLTLKREIETLKTDFQGRDQKLSVAAERIQGLLAKIEAVAS